MDAEALLTAEQFAAMPETPGKWHELVDGVVVEVQLVGALRGVLIVTFLRLLDPFALRTSHGEVFGAGLGYILTRLPDTVRGPDVSFIARERLPQGRVPEGFIDGVPDLAIEIVSPDNRADEVEAKVRHYLSAGTRLVWIVWPDNRIVAVSTPDGGVRELRGDDALTGGDVLPGFSVPVSEIFAEIA